MSENQVPRELRIRQATSNYLEACRRLEQARSAQACSRATAAAPCFNGYTSDLQRDEEFEMRERQNLDALQQEVDAARAELSAANNHLDGRDP